MRQFVAIEDIKARHHTAEDYSEEVDRQVDSSIRQQLQERDHLIIESWLSGFMSQGVPGVLKVLLVCSNELERARRLAERDGSEPHKAMKHAFKRLTKNNRRWEGMYANLWQQWAVQTGKVDPDVPIFFWHPYLYDLVIDTAVYNQADCLEMVLDKIDVQLGQLALA